MCVYISLLIKINVTKKCGNDQLHLFTYPNRWRITCAFRFNIQYIFVYLFKLTWTKAAQVTTYFYLLMQISYWLHVVFILIFIIYLFIYSTWCQQQQVEVTTCFYLLMQITCWFNVLFVLIFIISVYLFKMMSIKTVGSDHLFLFTYANSWHRQPLFTYAKHLWQIVFILIFSIYLFIYSN